jgi:hypothetical protein
MNSLIRQVCALTTGGTIETSLDIAAMGSIQG